MPDFIVDRFDGGDPEIVTIPFEDMPRFEVIEMARRGDAEAQRWLEAHPPEPQH